MTTTKSKSTPRKRHVTPSVDVYQMVTDKILAALEAGTVPWHNPASFQWPTNYASQKQYRGINALLLSIEAQDKGYHSPYWLTYNQALDAGGNVKRGQKGTTIVFWKQLKVADADRPTKADGTMAEKRIPLLRYYTVFNVDQCENVPTTPTSVPPVTVTGDSDKYPLTDNVINAYVTNGGPAYQESLTANPHYVPRTDTVVIPTITQYAGNLDARYAAAFHELVHSTGHSKRLDRGIDTQQVQFKSEPYAQEELVAEIGAAFLCAHAGIATATEDAQHAAYIAGWLKALRNDRKLVITAAGKAQRATDLIMGVTFDNDADD